jgi:hypothetical protein
VESLSPLPAGLAKPKLPDWLLTSRAGEAKPPGANKGMWGSRAHSIQSMPDPIQDVYCNPAYLVYTAYKRLQSMSERIYLCSDLQSHIPWLV